jgi:hypothetical protein
MLTQCSVGKVNHVSDEHIVSIFRVKKKVKQEALKNHKYHAANTTATKIYPRAEYQYTWNSKTTLDT